MVSWLRRLRPRTVKAAKQSARAFLDPLVKNARTVRQDLSPDLWNLRVSPKGDLLVHDIPLATLVEKYGSPLHVVNASKFDDNVRRFKVCADAPQAACKPFYSYKTNPVGPLLQRLDKAGVGAEVISPYELWLALELGVQPENIIFNGPGKTAASIQLAIERGIGLINCNHREEIAVVGEVARQLGKRPRVGLRVNTGLGWGGQFGIPMPEVLDAYAEAIAHPHLDVVAVHSHLGQRIGTLTQLHVYVNRLLQLCDELFAKLAFQPQILDVGGSLGVPTVAHLPDIDKRLNRTFLTDLLPPNPDVTISIDSYVRALHGQVLHHFEQARRKPPVIYMEPGRALTSNAQLLATRVMTLKHDQNANATFAVMDAGINLADACRFEYHQLFHASAMQQQATQYYRLAGPVCTPGDVIYWSWKLPALAPGDCLAIMDSGAYLIPFSTSFSYPQPAVVLVDNTGAHVLRRHETFEDLHRRDAERLTSTGKLKSDSK